MQLKKITTTKQNNPQQKKAQTPTNCSRNCLIWKKKKRLSGENLNVMQPSVQKQQTSKIQGNGGKRIGRDAGC